MKEASTAFYPLLEEGHNNVKIDIRTKKALVAEGLLNGHNHIHNELYGSDATIHKGAVDHHHHHPAIVGDMIGELNVDAHRSIEEILKTKVVDSEMSADGEAEDAFFVADMGEVVRQHHQWRSKLPRIEPFYAVKCNPDPNVVKTLVALGAGFDCASKGEISMVLDYGVDPSKLIYANPCKQASHIRYAAAHGVTMMTFDNADELRKIKQHMPNAQLVLRILTDDSKSLCKLGLKFGASLDSVGRLLGVARELGLNLVGVSFHVGSGCFDANAFGEAVRNAGIVMEKAKAYGFEMSLLDVGGGFPGNKSAGLSFESIVNVLGPAVDKYIPSHIRVIAEPGRYYVASAFTLAVNVVARRSAPRDRDDGSKDDAHLMSGGGNGESSGDDHPSFMYYINDGMYGSFNCITFDHAVVVPQILMRGGRFSYANSTSVADSAVAASSSSDSVKSDAGTESEYPCSIWGPTCDSFDCIVREGSLPELDVGDWMYFENMGAYTMSAASQFNGFRKSTIIYTNTFA